MENSDLNQLFQGYSESVVQRLQSDELLATFQNCSQFLEEHISNLHPWQVALPIISCLAAGGALEAGTSVATAWYPMYLASEVLDSVEDKEYIPDLHAPSPEIATNLATSLIFFAFYTLTQIKDTEGARQATRIFSELGFDATHGQHRDLTKTPTSVEEALNDYWEMLILKSGSVFRMATAGGAAAATADDKVIEALGDYGTALGVMLQLIDDCRDAFTQSQEAITWEISLPLLLYLMTIGEENIVYPQVSSKAEWSNLLRDLGVIHAISSILLEWKRRALESLEPLRSSNEKFILEQIPSLFLERLPLTSQEV